MIEYRVCWNFNMVGSDGVSDWFPWDGPEQTEDEVVTAALKGERGGIPSIAEETAWEGSGFEYWVETRVVDASLTTEVPGDG